MINKEYEMLLEENCLDDLYKFILRDYIELFSYIIVEKIQEIKDESVEMIFVYCFWKVFRYSKNYNSELLELRQLFLNIGWDSSMEKQVLSDMENLYYKIKEKSIKNEEINMGEYLKNLTKNNENELAIEIVQNMYFYPKMIRILEERKIPFLRYDYFSNIIDVVKENCKEYRNILLKIDGFYAHDFTLKEELNSLLELTENFE